jgi:hypothetical protein
MLIVTLLYIVSNILLTICFATTGPLSYVMVYSGVLFFGFGYSIGEITVYGYLKTIPMQMNKAFSAGTGIAPIIEGAFYIVLTKFGLNIKMVIDNQ